MKAPDHVRAGFLFIGFCVFVGVAVFFLSKVSSDRGSAEDVTETSLREGSCRSDEVELDLAQVEARGTLEILAPRADSDGYARRVYELSGRTCVPRSDLDELAKGAGNGESEPVTFLIGIDPRGTAARFRSRLIFEPDSATPLSEMPSPPGGMDFGEATWTVADQQERLSIDWYSDFGAWLKKQHYGQMEADEVPAADETGLAVYVGRYPFDPVNGLKFVERPDVMNAVRAAVNDPWVLKWVLSTDVTSTPISASGDGVLMWACEPHNCGPRNWAILLSQSSGQAAVCFHDEERGTSLWYRADAPVEFAAECPSEL